MRTAVLIGTAIWTWLALPAPAQACHCNGSCRTALTAPVLFEATVVALDPDPALGGGQKFVRLTRVRALRGQAPTVLEMEGSSCDVEFKAGARYLIEADQWAPGKFGASTCGLTRPAVRSAGFMAYLMAPPAERPRVWGTLTSPVVDHRDFVQQGGGPPVGGAVVTLSGPVTVSTTTTPTGEFLVGRLPDGQYQVVVETPRERTDVLPPDPQPLWLGPHDACMSVDLQARPTSRVEGVAVDARGRPLGQVQVELYTPPHNPFRRDFEQRPAISDASGRFLFDAVPPGTYVTGVGVPRPNRYDAYQPTFARPGGQRREFTVAPGAVVDVGPIVAHRVEPVTVHGHVTGSGTVLRRGLDVVVAAVDAEEAGGWRAATTDVDGHFTVELYRGVRYRLYALQDGQRTEPVTTVAGDGPIVIRLRP